MAKQRTTKSNSKKVDWVGFYEPVLDAAAKAEIREYIDGTFNVTDGINDLTQSGHKTSVWWDDKHNCHVFGAFCRDSSSPNAGLQLTTRHIDWEVALAACHWYVNIKCANGSWKGDGITSEHDW